MELFLNTRSPRILSVVRIVTAFPFMQHGAQKLLGFPLPQRAPFDFFRRPASPGCSSCSAVRWCASGCSPARRLFCFQG